MASEEMLFKKLMLTDADEGWLYYKLTYEPSAQVS